MSKSPILKVTNRHIFLSPGSGGSIRGQFLHGLLILLLLTPSLCIATDSGLDKIHLEITTYLGDRQTFVKGDRLSFLVSLDRDAYLLVLYETVQHQLIQLLPHRYSSNSKYKTGYYIPVPDEEARYQFVVAPPFGHERVLAFACDKPFATLPGTALANGLRQLTGTTTQLTQKLQQMCKENQGMYGKATLELTTRDH